MSAMKRILSIDASLTNCAWCFFEDTVLTDFGVLHSNKDDDLHIRVHYLVKELESIIKENQVELVISEGLSFGSISPSARILAHLFYSIETMCWLNEVDFTEVAPTAVKKYATGSGKAKKPDMFKALPQKIRDKFKNSEYKTINKGLHDLCDSFFVAQLGMSNLRYL